MLSERWRVSLPVVAAVVVVAALSLLSVTVVSSVGNDEDRASVGVDGSTTTTEATRRIAPRPTTTTTAEPEVLGETTEREPGVADGGAAAPAGDAPEPTSTPAPTVAAAPAPTTTTTAPPAPPTAVCRNSTEPSCGSFSWDPEPGEYEVEVYAVSTPVAATAGEPVTFAVEYVDPAGPQAEGACLNWFVTDPEVVNTSSCEVLATDCARTGPHDPPAPSRERILVEHTIEFQTPGEHQVTLSGNVATHLPDGCESPYANTLSRTFTIVVS